MNPKHLLRKFQKVCYEFLFLWKKINVVLNLYSWFECVFAVEESAVEALIELFYKQEELARAEEQKTDAILDGKKDSEQTETVSTTTKSQEEFIEETVAKRKFN